jgi:hypothetical protein
MILKKAGEKAGLAVVALAVGFLATWVVLENAPQPATAAAPGVVRRVEDLPPARIILPAPWESAVQQPTALRR